MKRELIIVANGRDRTVVIDGPRPDGGFRVTLDGAERDVDARQIRPGTWSIVLDGASFVVDLDPRAGGTRIAATVGASETTLQVEDALHRRLASAASPRGAQRGETLRAPIAGKVVKIGVALGDHVAPGTAVIVLEAMKMENEIIAERGGTVAAIHKTPGQAVETGEILVEIT